MTTVVGRLNNNGDLIISGEVNERIPVVTDGIIAHFPFDNTEKGKSFTRNLLNTSDWKIGTSGTQGHFGINGDGNQVIEFTNPWGYQEATWATLGNDSTSDADGGWNVTGRSIDHTKKYRLSVWIRRENAGNGRTYFGCQGSTVCNLSNGALNGNPYFGSWLANDIPEIIDNWVLFVYYIHPSSYTGSTDPTSGIYKLDGTKRTTGTDFKWEAGETVGGHRTYLYYSTSMTERQYWVRPRMELCDGTEATIEDLLKDRDDFIYLITNTNTTLTEHGIAIEESTTNVVLKDGQDGVTPWSGDGSGGSYIMDPTITFRGRKVARITPATGRNCYINGSGEISTSTTSTNWVFSLYIKRIDGNPITSLNSYMYVTNNSNVNTSVDSIEEVEDGWYKVIRTRTGLISGYPTLFGLYSLAATEYLIADWQLEPKTFATSYTNATRNAGRLDISFTLKPPYSINMWHKGIKPVANITDQGSSPMIFQLGDYYGNASISFWNYVKRLAVYIKGNTSSSWTSTKTYIDYTSNNWDNQEHMYTLVTVDNRTFKVYMDGELLGQQTSTEDVTNITYLSMGNSYQPNAHYRDLSLYNVSLTDDEINKLYNQSFKITEDGTILTNNLIEATHLGTGKDSTLTVSTVDTIVNQYAYVTTDILKGSISFTVEDATNFNVGDEILVIQMQHGVGIGTSGEYEFHTIKSKATNTLTTNTPIGKDFGSGTPNVANASSVTQIVKIPHYTNVTINANSSLTCDTWDGKKGGILIFRSQQNVVNNGIIHANGKGYRGGRYSGQTGYSDPSGDGECGEGYLGRGAQGFYSGANVIVSDGGGTTYVNGAGGSYGTQGTTATTYSAGKTPQPGFTYGDGLIEPKLFLGSGGGGGHNNAGKPEGGNGGGIIALYTKTINGTIESKGADGYNFAADQGLWGSGGGSGGSIYIETESQTVTTNVSGGLRNNGTSQQGGDGGLGISRVLIKKGINVAMRSKIESIRIQGSIKEGYL